MSGRASFDVEAVMSGTDRGARAALLRAGLRVIEPFYASAMRARNGLYSRGILKSHSLGRAVIGVGNLTTGGTGKTPVVRWLAERLRAQGRTVGILSRGYGAAGTGLGDELTMLDRAINAGGGARVFVGANADRVAGAAAMLAAHPEVDVLVLDDAFQHRRVKRDLNIVLISAANPFGYGHVLPRGLLREPVSGVRRAGAVVITHADQVGTDAIAAIERKVREHAPQAPIYQTMHAQVGFIDGETKRPIEALAGRRFFAFSGIGNPATFERQLSALGTCVGQARFPDHHRYSEADLESVRRSARDAGAEVLVTTEKDWVKIEAMKAAAGTPPIWRVEVRVRFMGDGEEGLINQVRGAIEKSGRNESGLTPARGTPGEGGGRG